MALAFKFQFPSREGWDGKVGWVYFEMGCGLLGVWGLGVPSMNSPRAWSPGPVRCHRLGRHPCPLL